MAVHSRILSWRIPRTEELGGLQCVGSHGVRHDWALKLSQLSEPRVSTRCLAPHCAVHWEPAYSSPRLAVDILAPFPRWGTPRHRALGWFVQGSRAWETYSLWHAVLPYSTDHRFLPQKALLHLLPLNAVAVTAQVAGGGKGLLNIPSVKI